MTAGRRIPGETYAVECTVCGRAFTYVYEKRHRLRCDGCRARKPETRTRGETYISECDRCHEPFEYVFESGKIPRTCDPCKRRGRGPFNCDQCGREYYHPGTSRVPTRCPECRPQRKTRKYDRERREGHLRLHIVGLRAESVYYRPQATEPPSERPGSEPQRVVPAPQPEPASVASEPAGEETAPPAGPSLSSTEQRRRDREQIAAANARLSEEDQRRVVQRVERERSGVQLVRRADDYDYVLVDGVPAKVRRTGTAR